MCDDVLFESLDEAQLALLEAVHPACAYPTVDINQRLNGDGTVYPTSTLIRRLRVLRDLGLVVESWQLGICWSLTYRGYQVQQLALERGPGR